MTRNNRTPRFIALVLAVSVLAFMAGAFSYPYLTKSESGPALKAGDFFMYPGFHHAGSTLYGPETMGAKIWFATGEMIQLPEDSYFSEKYSTWICNEGVETCPTVPVYRIVRGDSKIAIDGEGRIFAYYLNSEYLRAFAFLKERLSPDRTPGHLDQLHPAYVDRPCVRLKCEWW